MRNRGRKDAATTTGIGMSTESTAVPPESGNVTLRMASGETRELVTAIRNTVYSARLCTEDQIFVRGNLEIEIVPEHGDVIVPLPVAGAMVESVQVDGNPAPLVTLATSLPEVFTRQMTSQVKMNSMPAPEMPATTVGVRIVGRGVHQVTLSLRFRVFRQGGGRTISGVVPIGAAARMVIDVPDVGTTLSIGDESRGDIPPESYETTENDQRIETSLDTVADGPVVIAPAITGSPPLQ
ncbi:MAG: hypothetical protein Q4C47_09560, partial [Planctomycetia bacterium]|nr:hypothetical protein [Planctomycetia bacterium]